MQTGCAWGAVHHDAHARRLTDDAVHSPQWRDLAAERGGSCKQLLTGPWRQALSRGASCWTLAWASQNGTQVNCRLIAGLPRLRLLGFECELIDTPLPPMALGSWPGGSQYSHITFRWSRRCSYCISAGETLPGIVCRCRYHSLKVPQQCSPDFQGDMSSVLVHISQVVEALYGAVAAGFELSWTADGGLCTPMSANRRC
jgi:hypothetical protein